MAFLTFTAAACASSSPHPLECIAGRFTDAPSNVPTGVNEQPIANGPYTGNGDLAIMVGLASPSSPSPNTISLYHDLTQWMAPTEAGWYKCGYGEGGHSGVGWVGIDLLEPNGTKVPVPHDPRVSNVVMRQNITTAVVTTASTFGASGITLHSSTKVFATTNLAVTEVWWTHSSSSSSSSSSSRRRNNSTSASAPPPPPPASVTIQVTNTWHHLPHNPISAAGSAMDCSYGMAGHSDGPFTPISVPNRDLPYQWYWKKYGRGFQDTRLIPGRDRFPLIARVGHVAVGTLFGGEYLSRDNVNGSDANEKGNYGTHAWSNVTMAQGKKLRLSTRLWTGRDFDWTRDPLDAVGQSMGSAKDPSGAHIVALEAAHSAWWGAYYAKSSITMNTKNRRLEAFWYGAQYMWATSSKANWTAHMPPAGLWLNHYTGSDYNWPGYTTDLNTQAPYWAIYSSNHPEIAMPMYQLAEDFIPPGQMLSTWAIGCPGVLFPVEIGARGAMRLETDQGIRSNSLLQAINYIQHWEHTLDEEWLRNVGWTFVVEVADFWDCYLHRVNHTDGTYEYMDLNDCVYEICSDNDYPVREGMSVPWVNYNMQHNPINALAMLRRFYPYMIEWSALLGKVSDARRAQWQDIVDHLRQFPTTKDPYNSSKVIFADFELSDFSSPGPPPLHDRQLMGVAQAIYPGCQAERSMANRTLFEIAVNTMDYLQWYNMSSDGQAVMYTISGRIGANQTLIFPVWVNYNLFRAPQGRDKWFMNNLMMLPQIGSAMMQYVNELMVQSHEPFVRIYPAHFSDTGVEGGPPRGPRGSPSGYGPSGEAEPERREEAPQMCDLGGYWNMPVGTGQIFQTGKTTIESDCCERTGFAFHFNGTLSISPAHPVDPELPQCGEVPSTPRIAIDNVAVDGSKLSMVGTIAADCSTITWDSQPNAPYRRAFQNGTLVPFSDNTWTLRPWLGSSFSTLRLHGAFLASGSLSDNGVVGSVTITSEKGLPFAFLNPWPRAAGAPSVVVKEGGASVKLERWSPRASEVYLEKGEVLYRFNTTAGATYELSHASLHARL